MNRFRHVGDLGNIEEDGTGTVSFTSTDKVISLMKAGRSILGRSLMVSFKTSKVNIILL